MSAAVEMLMSPSHCPVELALKLCVSSAPRSPCTSLPKSWLALSAAMDGQHARSDARNGAALSIARSAGVAAAAWTFAFALTRACSCCW